MNKKVLVLVLFSLLSKLVRVLIFQLIDKSFAFSYFVKVLLPKRFCGSVGATQSPFIFIFCLFYIFLESLFNLVEVSKSAGLNFKFKGMNSCPSLC